MRSLLVLVVVTALALAGCSARAAELTASTVAVVELASPLPTVAPEPTATATAVPTATAEPTATVRPTADLVVRNGPTLAYAMLAGMVTEKAPETIGGKYDCDRYSSDVLLRINDAGDVYTFYLRCLWSTPGASIVEWHEYEATIRSDVSGYWVIEEIHILP